MSRIVKRTQVILDERKFRLTPEITPEIEEDIQEGAEEETSAAPSISEDDLREMVDEAVNEARVLTEQAREEADQIIERAMSEAVGIFEKAKQDGYEEGYNSGFEQGQAEAKVFIDDALMLKENAVSQYKKLLENAEAEIVELVIDTISTILNKHVEEDEDLVEGLIKSALAKCAYTDDLVLRVASEDYSYSLSIKDRILALAENVDTIEIKEDKSLSPGSCVIDTVAGSVDSSIATQFEQVRETYEMLLNSE